MFKDVVPVYLIDCKGHSSFTLKVLFLGSKWFSSENLQSFKSDVHSVVAFLAGFALNFNLAGPINNSGDVSPSIVVALLEVFWFARILVEAV